MIQVINDLINTPYIFILEVIIVCEIINLLFTVLYIIIYYLDEKHFASVKTNHEPRHISFFDMFYFANCTFFGAASSLTVTGLVGRIAVTVQIIFGYVFTALIIGRILSIPGI